MENGRAFWSVEPDDEGFDPVRYPEIKPYIARPPADDSAVDDAGRHGPAAIASALAALRRRSRERVWDHSARVALRRSGASEPSTPRRFPGEASPRPLKEELVK